MRHHQVPRPHQELLVLTHTNKRIFAHMAPRRLVVHFEHESHCRPQGPWIRYHQRRRVVERVFRRQHLEARLADSHVPFRVHGVLRRQIRHRPSAAHGGLHFDGSEACCVGGVFFRERKATRVARLWRFHSAAQVWRRACHSRHLLRTAAGGCGWLWHLGFRLGGQEGLCY